MYSYYELINEVVKLQGKLEVLTALSERGNKLLLIIIGIGLLLNSIGLLLIWRNK